LELINYYKYFKPSELLNESNPEEFIDAYLTEIYQKLNSKESRAKVSEVKKILDKTKN
jgi:hypothetical protein